MELLDLPSCPGSRGTEQPRLTQCSGDAGLCCSCGKPEPCDACSHPCSQQGFCGRQSQSEVVSDAAGLLHLQMRFKSAGCVQVQAQSTDHSQGLSPARRSRDSACIPPACSVCPLCGTHPRPPFGGLVTGLCLECTHDPAPTFLGDVDQSQG